MPQKRLFPKGTPARESTFFQGTGVDQIWWIIWFWFTHNIDIPYISWFYPLILLICIYTYIYIHVWFISTSIYREWNLESGFLGGVTPTLKELNHYSHTTWRLFKWPLRFAICLSVCHLLANFCLDLFSLDRILLKTIQKIWGELLVSGTLYLNTPSQNVLGFV